jgi:hypothetical protein
VKRALNREQELLPNNFMSYPNRPSLLICLFLLLFCPGLATPVAGQAPTFPEFSVLFAHDEGGAASLPLFERSYSLQGPLDGNVLIPGLPVAADNSGHSYFTTRGQDVYQLDTSTGAVSLMRLGAGIPELSWPMGITYDSKRNRLVLVSLGGEGFLYAYALESRQWSLIASMENKDFANLTYHPPDDSLYGVRTYNSGQGFIYRLAADGSELSGITIPDFRFGVGQGYYDVVLVSVGEKLALFVEPKDFNVGSPAESRIYLIDPVAKTAVLTFQKTWDIWPPKENHTPTVVITAPAQGSQLDPESTISITARASDDDGADDIANVEIYLNGQSIVPVVRVSASANTANYKLEWKDMVPGTYVITAKVTDKAGASAMSEPVSVLAKIWEPMDMSFAFPIFVQTTGPGEGIEFFKNYTYAGPQEGGLLLPGLPMISDLSGLYDYGTPFQRVIRVERATGQALDIPPVGPDFPEFSWPMGIASDLIHNKLYLVTLGGEGFLYSYDPVARKWSVVSSMHDKDFANLVFHPPTERLYGLRVQYGEGPGLIYVMSLEGQPLDEIPLPILPGSIPNGEWDAYMVTSGNDLVLLLENKEDWHIPEPRGESRIYVINPATKQVRLTYQKFWDQWPPVLIPPSVLIAAPTNGTRFEIGSSIRLEALATDDRMVQLVEFFANGIKLGDGETDSVPEKHEFLWNDVPAGNYAINARAIDNDGRFTSSAPVQIVVGPKPLPLIEASRLLPGGYSPGIAFTVQIQVLPGAGVNAWALEDQPPHGWSVSEISHEGFFDSQNGKVKFGPFTTNDRRLLSYRVLPPQTDNVGQFWGQVAANGSTFPIGGNNRIARVSSRHPADNNPADNRITIAELVGYATAWKTQQSWSIGPNPIPLDYVSRAGSIWKHGETYRFVPQNGSPPLCWVNTTASTTALSITGTSDANGKAERIFGGSFTAGIPVLIALQVSAGPENNSYVVEEKLPDDWQILWASHDGLSQNNVIRWGPFNDGVSRTLTYRAVSGTGKGFFGTGSFDGTTSFIQDHRNRPGIVISRNTEGRSTLRFQSDGGRWVLEYTDSLISGAWSESSATYSTNAEGEIVLTDSTADAGQRFYRLRAAE